MVTRIRPSQIVIIRQIQQKVREWFDGVFMCAYVFVCVSACIYIYIYIYIYAYVCKCIYVCVCPCVCVYVLVSICMMMAGAKGLSQKPGIDSGRCQWLIV